MLNSIFNTAILCCANIVCQCYAYNEVKFRLNKLNVSYKTGTEKYYCLILTTLAVLYLSLNQLSLIQSIIVIVFMPYINGLHRPSFISTTTPLYRDIYLLRPVISDME